MSFSENSSTDLIVGDTVEHMLTGETVGHLVKEIHLGEDAWVRTVCYAAYHLGLTKHSSLPVCAFCQAGKPDPDQLSDAIVEEPGFAEAFPGYAAAQRQWSTNFRANLGIL
jgi:hypothetical protein